MDKLAEAYQQGVTAAMHEHGLIKEGGYQPLVGGLLGAGIGAGVGRFGGWSKRKSLGLDHSDESENHDMLMGALAGGLTGAGLGFSATGAAARSAARGKSLDETAKMLMDTFKGMPKAL